MMREPNSYEITRMRGTVDLDCVYEHAVKMEQDESDQDYYVLVMSAEDRAAVRTRFGRAI